MKTSVTAETDEREQIAETRAAFGSALQRGDAAAASGHYTEGAKLLAPSSEPIRGRTEIEAFWKAGVEAGLSEIELEALAVESRDRIVFETGRYALRVRPADGSTVVDRGTYVLVHERQEDGRWRRALEMLNPETGPGHDHGARPG